MSDEDNIHKISERTTVNNMNIQTVFNLLKRTREELQNAQNRIAALEQQVAQMNESMSRATQQMYRGAVIGSTGPR